MSYHDILVKVGDFGLYQKLLCGIFVFYTTFLCGLNFYTQVTVIFQAKRVPPYFLHKLDVDPGVHLQHAGPPVL